MIDSTPGVFENAQVDIYPLVPVKIGQYTYISPPPPEPGKLHQYCLYATYSMFFLNWYEWKSYNFGMEQDIQNPKKTQDRSRSAEFLS